MENGIGFMHRYATKHMKRFANRQIFLIFAAEKVGSVAQLD